VGRRRAYDRATVIAAAEDVFWDNGYTGTALADIEAETGLNRSSLYLAFGSKQELFQRALDHYIATVLDPLLEPMEADGAIALAVEQFFRALARQFRGNQHTARRGCL
jgi:TetR/AcrR family transcriptional regulator, transcriptional repressor for nem operon